MITCDFPIIRKQFPCGEPHFTAQGKCGAATVTFDYQKADEIFELALIADAILNAGGTLHELVIYYVPFGRQDRIANFGECFSLKVFAGFINSLGFHRVVIHDPHSDVTPALINNSAIIEQRDVLAPYFMSHRKAYLVAPDAGALKKTYKLEQRVGGLGVVECSKKRNVQTGEITDTIVHHGLFNEDPCIIVDDICDGGATFIAIANELKKKNAGEISLMVTHGFFTKGLEVFDGVIDHIYTRKGKVK